MATVDTIRNITIKASTDGVDTSTAALNKLSDAQDNVAKSGQSTATATDTVASKQLSAQGAFDKLRTSIDSQYKSQQQMTKGETVLNNALSQGIITTGTYAQMHQLLSEKYAQATPLSEAFAKTIGGLESQMVALSAGLGPVGVMLSSFGGGGLAVAAGIGLASDAISKMIGMADQMGDLARQMQNFAATTGLTTDQIQVLETTGAKFGASSEQVSNTLVRFSVSLAQLRQGTGPLYTDLNKINPQLVQQLSSTKEVATAWNLLAAAYVNADQAQQNLLSRAIGGQRGNAGATSQILSATAGAGGLSGLQSDMQQIDMLTQQQIAEWAQLKTSIDEATTLASHNIGSIFTSQILADEKVFADAFLDISRAAKDLASTEGGGAFFANMASSIAQAIPGLNLLVKVAGIAQGLKNQAVANSPENLIQGMVGTTAYPPPLSPDLVPPSNDTTGSPQVLAGQYQKLVAALGPAATYSEKLHSALLTLNADYANAAFGVVGTTTAMNNFTRAVQGVQLANAVTVTAAYVGALGPLASVTDQVNLKQLQLSKLMADGVPLTHAQETAILNLTRANAEWTQVNARASAGVYDVQAASKAAGDELQSWIDRGLIDPSRPEQLANAYEILAAKQRQLQQSALDANPVLKALTDQQFALATATMSSADAAAAMVAHQLFPADWQAHLQDAAPAMAAFNSQIKDAMGLSENFANAFGQAMIQGKTMSEAMLSAVQSLESQLISMISKRLVDNAFGGLLNYLIPSFGAPTSLAPGGTYGGTGLLGIGGFYEKGGMVTNGPARAWIHPAYFENAPHFAGGGMITDGGVPIIAHPGERILNRAETAAYNSGGGATLHFNTVNNFPTNADPQFRAEMKAYVDQSSRNAVVQAVTAVARAKKNNPGYLG